MHFYLFYYHKVASFCGTGRKRISFHHYKFFVSFCPARNISIDKNKFRGGLKWQDSDLTMVTVSIIPDQAGSSPIALLLNTKWEILSELVIKCITSMGTKLTIVILI